MGTGVARSGALEAIVLAGGAGSRFGGGKLLAPWRQGLLIEAALDAAFAAPVRSVVLVTGADAGVMPVALEYAMREGEMGRLRIVHARDHAQGLSATLKAGLDALPPDTAGAFVFLGDMPTIPPEVPPALARALVGDVIAAAPTFEGRRGHPVLFGAALFPSLTRLSGDEGGRSVLLGLAPAQLATVATPFPGVLFDVDVPEDLARSR
jgi:molybdenum cofactor cytidylyltransferase